MEAAGRVRRARTTTGRIWCHAARHGDRHQRDRAAAYGMPGERVEDNDVEAVYEAAGAAVARARARRRTDPDRGAHAAAAGATSRVTPRATAPRADRRAGAPRRDPRLRGRAWSPTACWTTARRAEVWAARRAEVDEAIAFAKAARPDPARPVRARRTSSPDAGGAMTIDRHADDRSRLLTTSQGDRPRPSPRRWSATDASSTWVRTSGSTAASSAPPTGLLDEVRSRAGHRHPDLGDRRSSAPAVGAAASRACARSPS